MPASRLPDPLHAPRDPDEVQRRLAALEAENAALRARLEAGARDPARSFTAGFEEMADVAPAMLWVTDPSGACTYLSHSWFVYTGQTEATGLGFGWTEAVHPDDRAMAAEVFLAANARRVPFRLDYRLRSRDGHYRWAIDAGAPRWDAQGAYLGYVGSVIDIHDRKQAEQALAERNEQLQMALEAGNMGTWRVDPVTGNSHIDAVEAQLFGLPPGTETLTLETFYERVHPDDRERVRAEWQRALERGDYHVEFRVVHPDGAIRWLSGVGGVYRGAASAQKEQMGLNFDITERVRAAAVLEQSEARFRATFEQAAVGVAHLDHAGNWLRVNDRLCEIVGYSREELLASRFQDITHADDLSGDLRQLDALLRGDIATYQIEKRYVRKSGEVLWVHLTVSAVRSADTGQVDYLISVVEDITVRKKAEADLQQLMQTLEEQVRQRTAQLEAANELLTARNKELRDFAHVASHDLQEPLRKIQAFSGLLRSEQEALLTPDGLHYLSRIEAAAARMSALTAALLSYSRVATRPNPFGEVDLEAVVRQACDDLSLRFRETGATLETDGLGTATVDAVQVQQLMLNLISNALKYHRPGVPPHVVVRARRIDGEEGVQGVRLEVEDNGIGFDTRYLDRIFVPFQRLHGISEYEGTGMGLAICRRIAERHGGSITATSTPGEGSCFTVELFERDPGAGDDEEAAGVPGSEDAGAGAPAPAP